MKVAIIGSRSLIVNDLEKYLPADTTEIVSGGAVGIDRCARRYAQQHGLKLTELLPDYETYGKYAPLKRNLEIIEYADIVYAFWDGKSNGTSFVINNCKKMDKKVRVFKVRL